MSGQQYHLHTTLHAVDAKEGHGFVTIPEGALVIVAGDADDRRFVPVRWGDQELFVFEQDLNASCRTRIIGSSDIDRR